MKSCYQLIITITISEKKKHIGQTSLVGTVSEAKNLEISQFFFLVNGYCDQFKTRAFPRGVSFTVFSYLFNVIVKDLNGKLWQHESIKTLLLQNNATFFNHLHCCRIVQFCLCIYFFCLLGFIFFCHEVCSSGPTGTKMTPG